jgi:hypothetical protein
MGLRTQSLIACSRLPYQSMRLKSYKKRRPIRAQIIICASCGRFPIKRKSKHLLSLRCAHKAACPHAARDRIHQMAMRLLETGQGASNLIYGLPGTGKTQLALDSARAAGLVPVMAGIEDLSGCEPRAASLQLAAASCIRYARPFKSSFPLSNCSQGIPAEMGGATTAYTNPLIWPNFRSKSCAIAR